MKLSVITTFRNEEATLPEFIRRVTAASKRCIDLGFCSQYEIILVNDDSTDRSLEILREISKQSKAIRVVTTSRVFGVDECFVLALKHATGDYVACLESDLQDPPELIPKLLALLISDKNCDVVDAVKEKRLGESPLRQLITRIGYQLLYGSAYVPLPKQASNFKVFTKRVAKHVNGLNESKPFFRGMIAWAGYRHRHYQFERSARFAGESKFPILGSRVVGNFLNAALISFSSLPLKLPLIVGAVLIALTCLAFGVGVLMLLTGKSISSPWVLGFYISGLASLQFLFIGILGLYLHTVFLQSKNRPVCVVKSMIGFDSFESKPFASYQSHREYVLEK